MTNILLEGGTSLAAASIKQHVKEMALDVQAQGVDFYLASNASVKEVLNCSPLDLDINFLDFLKTNPLGWSTTDFLRLGCSANGFAFGPRGLPMPNWVMIDLALMPSAMLFATVSKDLLIERINSGGIDPLIRDGLQQVLAQAEMLNFQGPIPVAGYCAAPTADGNRWIGWSLWSLLPGLNLGYICKGVALEAYKAKYLDGVTQYDSKALRTHTKFGSLGLKCAHLDLHTASYSFVYEADLADDDHLNGAEPSFLLDPADVDRQKEMQAAIEAGTSRFYIVPPGAVEQNGTTYVPIVELNS